MRHDDGEPAVGRGEAGDALRRAVRVLRIGLGNPAMVIHVAHRHKRVSLVSGRIEHRAALAVRGCDRHAASGHALEEHRRARRDFHLHVARLELFRAIAQESRPLRSARDQRLERGHHLAAVADAKGESVAAGKERLEILARAGIEQDRLGPALSGAEHVAIREPAAGYEARESCQAQSARNDVAHVHIGRIEACAIESRRHFDMAVDALLAQDRHARARALRDEGRSDVLGRIVSRRKGQPRIPGLQDARVLFVGALRVVAQALHAPRGFGPSLLQVDPLLGKERLGIAREADLVLVV